jgi:hypothetical protein
MEENEKLKENIFFSKNIFISSPTKHKLLCYDHLVVGIKILIFLSALPE